jgi:integrase
MFQRRVFKPLLKELQIQKRDLYACRHTFATKAVRQGMKPHEVAYLMGDQVDTVLHNYFHNHQRPVRLPESILSADKVK